MKDFSIVFTKSFKFCWRDIASVAIFVAFPIVIIFVLGQALGGLFDGGFDFQGETIPVAIVAAEDSPLSAFLQSEEISHFLGAELVADKETAIRLLNDVEVFLVVIETDGEPQITLPNTSGVNALIALSLIESYHQIGAAMTIAAIEGRDMAELAVLAGADISVQQAALGNRTMSGIDFYAVTMMTMLMLFAGENGLQLFKKSMFGETGNRMFTTPVSKFSLTAGLLAAAVVATFMQGLVIFGFTKFVYGVYWGERIALVLLTLFGLVLFAQSFAIFLFMAFKNASAAGSAMQALIFVFTFLAGGFMGPALQFGESMERVIRFIPNSLAQTVLFGGMFGGDESRMMTDLGLLFAYSGVLFILAYLFGRRKLA
jgi:ABC-2 type transport system permease protein